MAISDDLLALKKKIETAKTETSRLEGRLSESMSRLKTEFNVGTLDAARKLRDKMQEELVDLDDKIEKGVKELNKMMGV